MHFSVSATSGRADDRQIDESRGISCAIDALCGFAVVARRCEENVVDVGLRITVVEREPARLDLHHDAVPGQEDMVDVRQCEAIGLHLSRRYRAWAREAVTVAPTEYVHGHWQLIAAHGRLRGYLVREHVDQLHDPVA